MFYINKTASISGNYGNPVSNPYAGALKLPDNLLSAYIQAMGFATLTVEDDVVQTVAVNQEAYDAYAEAHPATPEEPSEEEDLMGMAVDHEYRLTLLELGLTDM